MKFVVLRFSALLFFTCCLIQCSETAVEAHEKGKELFEKEQFSEAIDELSRSMREGGPSYFKSYYRGLANFKLQKHQAAIADLKQAIGLDPNHPGAYFSLGYTYHAIKKDEEAMQQYNLAIERIDLNQLTEESKIVGAKSFFNRGILYGGFKKFQEAIDDYTQSIALNPAYGDAYYRRGIFRLVLSQGQQGCDDINIGMQKGSPDHYNVKAQCQGKS